MRLLERVPCASNAKPDGPPFSMVGDEILVLGSHSCDPRRWIYTPVILGGEELDTLL